MSEIELGMKHRGIPDNFSGDDLKIAVAYDRLGTWPQEATRPADLDHLLPSLPRLAEIIRGAL